MIHRLWHLSSPYSALLILALLGLSLELYAAMTAYSRELRNLKGELRRRTASFQSWRGCLDSLSEWTNKRRRGYMRIAGVFVMTACLGFIILGSMALPVERASVQNQTTILHNLYLPHVAEEMDQFHFWVDPDGDATRRTLFSLCADGLIPPWNEGQTIVWAKVHVERDCLRLLGYDGARDKQHKIINDGGE